MENIQLKLIKLLKNPEDKVIKISTTDQGPFYMSLNDFRRKFVNTEILISSLHQDSPIFNYLDDDRFITDLTPIIAKMGKVVCLEGV
jgi:hypothetical protein